VTLSLQEWVTPAYVRKAPKHVVDDKAFEPAIGELVEAKAMSSVDEPYSWWAADVRGIDRSRPGAPVYDIVYSDWGDAYNERVDASMLRRKSTEEPITVAGVHRKEIPIPARCLVTDAMCDDVLRTVHSLMSLSVKPDRRCVIALGMQNSVQAAELVLQVRSLTRVHVLFYSIVLCS
jgi:hypothetical protein